MTGRIFRVLFGFVVACIAAGLVLVLFVNTPGEFPDWPSERFSETGLWALAVGTHAGLFSAPFALIGTLYAEWRGISSATYSVILGVLIAMVGFAAQYAGDGSGGDVNPYALSAFIVTGIVGGLVYWYVSGRYAQVVPPSADTDKSEPSTPFAVKKPLDGVKA